MDEENSEEDNPLSNLATPLLFKSKRMCIKETKSVKKTKE